MHSKRYLFKVLQDPIAKNLVFLVSLLLFFLHQITQKVLHIQISWADHYMDMFVLMPIVLTLYTLERKYLFQQRGYSLTLLEACAATLLVGIVSELLFPRWSNRFTRDPLDIVYLILGASIYYVSLRVQITEKNNSK